MATAMLTSTKTYSDLPCAHRQWRHDGNCALVHGYSRSYRFVFGAVTQDKCGFIVDFGDLKWVKAWLEYMFDHTLLLCEDDPLLPMFRDIEAQGGAKVHTMPYGVGMEGSAQMVCEYVDKGLRERTKGRAWVISVEAIENPKNSAIFTNPEAGFQGWR